jgi:hypothetical protein
MCMARSLPMGVGESGLCRETKFLLKKTGYESKFLTQSCQSEVASCQGISGAARVMGSKNALDYIQDSWIRRDS